MTRREEQAYNDGRLAFRDHTPRDRNPRRGHGSGQRQAWFSGWDFESRLDAGEKATPEQRAETNRNIDRLHAWAEQFKKDHR